MAGCWSLYISHKTKYLGFFRVVGRICLCFATPAMIHDSLDRVRIFEGQGGTVDKSCVFYGLRARKMQI